MKAKQNLRLSSYGKLYFIGRKERNGISVAFHPTMDSNGHVDTGFVGKTAFLILLLAGFTKKNKKKQKKKEKNKDECYSVPNVRV